MKLIISESKYKTSQILRQVGIPLILIGVVAGELFLGYQLGLLIILMGFILFAIGLIQLNQLFVCPHCGSKMITNAKKDFKKGKTPEICPQCKKKVIVEIE